MVIIREVTSLVNFFCTSSKPSFEEVFVVLFSPAIVHASYSLGLVSVNPQDIKTLSFTLKTCLLINFRPEPL